MSLMSLVSGVITIDSVDYCVSDATVDHNTEVVNFPCMNEDIANKFAGQEDWSGSATLAYDSGGMDALRGESGSMEFIFVTSTGNTITLSGDIVVSSANSTFNKTDVPTMEITFMGDGDLDEQVDVSS